ncbi:MAG TPA: M28 family peptidase, partial [Novosphingobium sp.]|nr:M28 family peptidase [Novosphingobium sp.]
MKFRLALALAALASAASLGARAPDPHAGVPKVAVPQVSVETLQDVTRFLAADELEGRAPGTRGEEKTVAYLIDRFAKAGLEPGNKGSWLQSVPMVEIDAVNHTGLRVTGAAEPLHFAFGSDMVSASYRAVDRTEIADAELVFVGHGIVAPELGWNDYAGLDMAGKVAVILVNDPDYAAPDETGPFRGRRMTYYGRWTYKFEEAARQGAAAALVVHDTFPAGYGWGVVETSWTGPQPHVDRADQGMSATLANGWVQKRVADALFRAAGHDPDALIQAARQPGFRPVPLGLKASMAFDSRIRRTTSANVIGVLPGRKRKDEAVLYTAHWDHLGRCKPVGTDDICNGAADNATGIAALVALAEANRRMGPADRSQVFIAFTLEEAGLLGSQFYAQNPVHPLARTVGGINFDAIQPGPPARDVMVIGGDKSGLSRYLRAGLARLGLAETPETTPERGSYYRSDHFPLARLGVPMLYPKRGTDWVAGGREAGDAAAQDYTDNRYHKPGDEVTPDWDWSGIHQFVEVSGLVGRSLAMSGEW